MTLEEYKKELDAHDWYYFYSDSISVYTKGNENEKRLIELAKDKQDFVIAYNEKYSKMFKN